MIAIAAIVDVDERAIGLDPPAQDLRVLVGGAGLEHREELGVALDELDEARVAVVAIEVREVALDVGALQPRGQRQRRGVEAALERREPMQREDVADLGLGLEPEKDVVAEQHVAADGHEIRRRAVVLGPHALGRDELRLGRPEQRLAADVQRVRALRELATGGRQARAQDLVVATGEGGIDIGGGGHRLLRAVLHAELLGLIEELLQLRLGAVVRLDLEVAEHTARERLRR